jgi:hypothetical protein
MTNGVQEFIFANDGQGELSINANDQTAVLAGRLIPLGASSEDDGFDLLLTLSTAPTGSYTGMDELKAGVSVDMSSWTYFTVSSPSYIDGFGSYSGSNYTLMQQEQMMPLQLGNGANGKNLDFGAAVWLNIIISESFTIAADININLNCTLYTPSMCPNASSLIAVAAQDDSFALYTGGSAFTFFNAPSDIGTMSWVFDSNGGLIVQSGSEFVLTGTIVPLLSTATASSSFAVNLHFRSPTQSELLSISMLPAHKELASVAYVQAGGPVDASSWLFFMVDTASSSITNSDGTSIVISTQMGMPAQVGIGANGKNIRFGASGWFDYEVMKNGASVFNGSMDINLDLDCPNMNDNSASESESSSSSSSSSPSSDCSVTVVTTVRTSWFENVDQVSLYDVIVTNDGSLSVTSAIIKITYPGHPLCGSTSTCTRETWGLGTTADPFTFGLPSWLSDFSGLLPNTTMPFGLIATAAPVSITVEPTCS